MNQPRTYKRKNRLPQPGFQLRMVGIFASLCALAVLGHTLVTGVQLTEAAGTLPSGGVQLAEALPTIMVRSTLISLAFVLPALLVIGIRITFRFAGPLYRIERHLEEVARGNWPGPCKIRKTDDMQKLCQLMNAALESARAQGEADHTEDVEQDRRLAG